MGALVPQSHIGIGGFLACEQRVEWMARLSVHVPKDSGSLPVGASLRQSLDFPPESRQLGMLFQMTAGYLKIDEHRFGTCHRLFCMRRDRGTFPHSGKSRFKTGHRTTDGTTHPSADALAQGRADPSTHDGRTWHRWV